MKKVYLVYERESFDDYSVILVTESEEKAQELSGEEKPCGYRESGSCRYYEVWELEKEENPYTGFI